MSDSPIVFVNSPDALSLVIERLQLHAEIYVNGDFCGAWAVDTSGSRRMPFHLVGRGEAWLHTEGAPVQPLSAGKLVLFPHDDRHVLSCSPEPPPPEIVNAGAGSGEGAVTRLICGFFEFRNRAAWSLLDALAPVVLLDLGEARGTTAARRLVDLIVEELDAEQPGFYAAVNHLAHLLFVQIVRRQIEAGAVPSGLLAALFEPRRGRALGAMHRRPERQWTLAALAQEAHMGRSSFARRFHDLTGVPPMHYLAAWRMQEARSLLERTGLPLGDIAERCGYRSEPAFRKAFRKLTGRTPGSVRRAAAVRA